MFKPPIGFPIQWYNGAVRLEENIQAATVLGYSGDLLIIETVDMSGTKRVRRDQRHMDDPFLATHQTWCQAHGAWDYVPGLYVNLHQMNDTPDTSGSAEPEVVPEVEKPLRGREKAVAAK